MDDVVVVGGGQSGLAAARALRAAGLAPIVLEAGTEPVGSWPHYYDSLKLFSPAAYSGFPGFPFRGDPERYPPRAEVVDYLREYAATLDVDIRTECRVTSVESTGDRGFLVTTDTGEAIHTAGVVAATGSFGQPPPARPARSAHLYRTPPARRRLSPSRAVRRPARRGRRRGRLSGPGRLRTRRGGHVTIATRRPIAFLPQRIDGRDLHYWLERTGFDDLPPEWLARLIPDALVTDTGRYRAALESGRPDRRPMFTALDGEHVVWSDGTREVVDTIVLATGYRPHLDYLRALGALTDGLPQHAGGISTTHPGLAYVGIEFQRSYASNTLRGVHRDAEYIAPAIAAHVRDAGALVRLWHSAVPACHRVTPAVAGCSALGWWTSTFSAPVNKVCGRPPQVAQRTPFSFLFILEGVGFGAARHPADGGHRRDLPVGGHLELARQSVPIERTELPDVHAQRARLQCHMGHRLAQVLGGELAILPVGVGHVPLSQVGEQQCRVGRPTAGARGQCRTRRWWSRSPRTPTMKAHGCELPAEGAHRAACNSDSTCPGRTDRAVSNVVGLQRVASSGCN